MQSDVREIAGNWDAGYAVDKHKVRSIFTHYDEYGHPRFDTERTEVGEALYQLKYRGDWSRIEPLAEAIRMSVMPRLGKVGLIIPMPASTIRARQPVTEIARSLGKHSGIPVFEKILTKNNDGGASVKDLHSKQEKQVALQGRFHITPEITNEGRWNALLIDDLFDTGASMEAACTALRSYSKIDRIYVAALTWRS